MREIDVHNRLNDDLWFFAENAPLVIKDDQGHLIVWRPNIAQRYMQHRAEAQRHRRGWVRLLLLKGRQQGGSTWVNGRYYHRSTRVKGQSVLIISHEGKTTDKLFDMVRRFQDNVHPALRPGEGKSNARQMTFPGLASEYGAITAGSPEAGRGFTTQLLHGSEIAYWEHAYEIQDGALKSIRLAPGTEVILESTANGPKGLFYEKCMAALRGEGDYELVFVPWFWEDDYEREVDSTFVLTEEEERFAATHFDKPFPFQLAPISRARIERKLAWRRAEIVDLAPTNPEAGQAKFRSIYPSNPVEAFLNTGVGEIRASAIVAARALDGKLEIDPIMPRIGALDPAGEGKKSDRSIYGVRQGNVVDKVLRFAGLNGMELVARMARAIEQDALDMLFVDNGYGKQIVERLHELGFKRKVIGVWFNEAPSEPNRFTNKRSEIILTFADRVNAGGMSIPDGPERQIDANCWACGGDEIHADLAALPLHRETSDGKRQMPAKEEITKALGRSCDIADMLGLTESYPVHRADPLRGNVWRRADGHATISQENRQKGGPLRSLARKREMR